MNKTKTLCTHCSLNCGYFLVRDREVEGIEYWRAHPLNQGALCDKGNTAYGAIYSDRRLLHPSVRAGGKLRRVSWEKALGAAADRLGKIKRRSGANSIHIILSGSCTNEEMALARDFAAVIGTENIYTSFPQISEGLEGAIGRKASKLSEVAASDSVLIIGNPVEQNPVSAKYILAAKYESSAWVTVAGTGPTPTAWFSNIALQHAPGAEAAVLSAMAKVVVESGAYDKRRVERIPGFAGLRRSLKAINIDGVCRSAGISPAALAQAASRLAGAKKPVIVYTASVAQRPNLQEIVKAIANLALLTNAGVCPLHGPANARGAAEAGISGAKSGRGMKAAVLIGNADGVRADFVVSSQTFLPAGTRPANVVLPAAGFAEKRGTLTNVDGAKYVSEKAVDPPGEVRSDSEILVELAGKMGLEMTPVKAMPAEKPERGFQRVNARVTRAAADDPTAFNAEYELICSAIDAARRS